MTGVGDSLSTQQHDDGEDETEGTTAAPVATEKPTNERLLCTAFVSFMTFASVQTVVAIIAGSEALLGDSAAMAVDALTYLCNWHAERQKQRYAAMLQEGDNHHHASCGKRQLEYRRHMYRLELLPPVVSVSALLCVTVLVLRKAIHILILDTKRDISEQSNPNIELMLLFSVLNLFLDCLNVFCFAQAKHAMGYDVTVDNDANEEEEMRQVGTLQTLLGSSEHNQEYDELVEDDPNKGKNHFHLEPLEIDMDVGDTGRSQSSHHDEKEGSNLNMCSAYTHVFADTLRSIAVIVAAVLAEFVPSITPEEADAAAAVMVSILIAMSLFPLLGGIVETYRSLKRVEVLIAEEDLENEDGSAALIVERNMTPFA